jgi:hypothetical protein
MQDQADCFANQMVVQKKSKAGQRASLGKAVWLKTRENNQR